MKEEYTRETYPSIGKKYNGEKAIISLTSWKARINTVSKTLFSLIKQCPGFHIVLVLSEEEFPLMEKELPKNLMLFVENNLIEILWVYKNYKSLKKILFTMDKYREVPIISADDDCFYKFNYAEAFYKKWLLHKDSFITFYMSRFNHIPHTGGYATLHPPYCYGNILKILNNSKLNLTEDDNVYTAIRYVKHLYKCISLNKSLEDVVITHDEHKPLHDKYRNDNKPFNKKIREIINIINNK